MSKFKESVSIIIPTYNRSAHLRRALESVMAQDIDCAVQVIVVDDGSTDDTKARTITPFVQAINANNAVKKKYSFVYYKNPEEPKGPSPSRNKGLEYATSDYIMFLDSDDVLYSKTSIQSLVNGLRTNREDPCKVVYGDTLMFGLSSAQLWEVRHEFSFPVFSLKRLADSGGLIPTGSFMFSKEVYEDVGGFNEKIKLGEDYEWQLRVASKYPFKHIDQTILKYYRAPTGLLTQTTTNIVDRKQNHDMVSKAQKDALKSEGMSYKKEMPISIPDIPYSEDMGLELLSFRDEMRTRVNSSTHSVPVDIYYGDRVFKNGNVDGLAILWVLSPLRINSRGSDICSEYDVVLSHNCSLAEKLKAISHIDVKTLSFPWYYDIYTPNRCDVAKKENHILVQDMFDYAVMDLLEDHNIQAVDLESTPREEIFKYPGIIVNKGKYFNTLEVFSYARTKLPLFITQTKGYGLAPNNGGMFIRPAHYLMDEVAECVSLKDTDRYDNIGFTGYRWASTHPDFSMGEFINKFSAIMEEYTC